MPPKNAKTMALEEESDDEGGVLMVAPPEGEGGIFTGSSVFVFSLDG
jgi:hypothetical protein